MLQLLLLLLLLQERKRDYNANKGYHCQCYGYHRFLLRLLLILLLPLPQRRFFDIIQVFFFLVWSASLLGSLKKYDFGFYDSSLYIWRNSLLIQFQRVSLWISWIHTSTAVERNLPTLIKYGAYYGDINDFILCWHRFW